MEVETDQSDEELESRDNEREAAGSDVSSEQSETEEEDESDISSEGEEEEEEEEEEERDVREEGATRGRGFTAVALDRVQEDREKGKAVTEQISKSCTGLHH